MAMLWSHVICTVKPTNTMIQPFDSPIIIPYFELNVGFVCNLSCKECGALVPQIGAKEFSRTDECCTWLEQYAKLLQPERAWILGGEPFMHDGLLDIAKCFRKHYPNTHIEITTNGTLLHTKNDKFFTELATSRIGLFISDHFATEEWGKRYTEQVTRLNALGVPTHAHNHTRFQVMPIFNTNARTNEFSYQGYQACFRQQCLSLTDGKMFRCSYANALWTLAQTGKSETAVKQLEGHKYLTPQATPEEVYEFLFRIPDLCKYCTFTDWVTVQQQKPLLTDLAVPQQ